MLTFSYKTIIGKGAIRKALNRVGKEFTIIIIMKSLKNNFKSIAKAELKNVKGGRKLSRTPNCNKVKC